MSIRKKLLTFCCIAVTLLGCQEANGTGGSVPPPTRAIPTTLPTSETGAVNTDPIAPPSSADSNTDIGNTGRFTGFVKWFSPQKGYGFIETEDGDLFVHYSGIAGEGYRTLEEGQQVEYSMEEGPKGPEAVDVVVVGGEAQVSTPAAGNDFDENQRYQGVVKWFSPQKGYGFIETEDGDLFVHYSGIAGEGYKTLEEGQQVEYSMEEGPKGPEAVDVVVTDP